MLENTEGAFKNGQSSETGDIVYTRGIQAKKKNATMRHQTQITLDSKHIHFIYSWKPYDNTCLF